VVEKSLGVGVTLWWRELIDDDLAVVGLVSEWFICFSLGRNVLVAQE